MEQNLSQKIIKITNAVYRVTNLFPEKEPLRNQIREKAGEIVLEISQLKTSDKVKEMCYNIDMEIEGIIALFNIAEKQAWVSQINLEVLKKAYSGLKESLKIGMVRENKDNRKLSEKDVIQAISCTTNNRHTIILDYLKGNERIQVGQVCQLFPQISRRTLIRDLNDLVLSGKIERNGGGRGIAYKIKQNII